MGEAIMANYTIVSPSSQSDQPQSSKYTIVPPSSAGIWYNDAGQAIDKATGQPLKQPPDSGYTGTFLPLKRDATGLHLAVPEAVSSLASGAVQGGQRALGVGENGRMPLRPLSPEMLTAVAAGVGTPIAGMADRGMLGASTLQPGGALAPSMMSRGAVAREALPSSGISTDRALLAKEARDTFGIPVTAPQIGMSRTMQTADATLRRLPLSGAREHEMATRRAWNRALSKTFGENDAALTPQVMSRAKKRIGSGINDIENSHEVNFSPSFTDRLAQIENAARSGLTDQEYAVVRRQIDNVLRNVMPGDKLAGTTYGNLLHRNSPLAQAASNTNSNISRPAKQIMEALQDSLQESLGPDKSSEYRNLRFQYKNMKTLEPLINKSPTGEVSPALLNERVSKQFPNRAFDTSGNNPLDRLARIGQAFLKEPGTSHTAENRFTMEHLGELGAAVVAGDVLGIGKTLGGIGGLLTGGRLLGNYMRSPALAEKTIEKAMKSSPKELPRASGDAKPRTPSVRTRLTPSAVESDNRRRNKINYDSASHSALGVQ